jgi:uncharacterized protein (DUF1778 family)
MPRKNQSTSGASNLKQAGRVGVLVSMTAEQRQSIRVAAAKAGKSMSAWMLEIALRESLC